MRNPAVSWPYRQLKTYSKTIDIKIIRISRSNNREKKEANRNYSR